MKYIIVVVVVSSNGTAIKQTAVCTQKVTRSLGTLMFNGGYYTIIIQYTCHLFPVTSIADTCHTCVAQNERKKRTRVRVRM